MVWAECVTMIENLLEGAKGYGLEFIRFNEILGSDVYGLAWDELIDIELDGCHETMKRLSKELRFEYERIEKKAFK